MKVAPSLRMGFLSGSVVKKIHPQCRRDTGDGGLIPGSGRPPWRRAWQPTPIFLPGKFHGQRTLVGYDPWSHKELDRAEATEHAHTHDLQHWQGSQSMVWYECRHNLSSVCPLMLTLLRLKLLDWPAML